MSDFADDIMSALTEYGKEVTQVMKQAVSAEAKKVPSEIGKRAGEQKIGGKKYIKSWRAKKVYEDEHTVKYTVHSTEYRLAHLLENGHLVANQYGSTLKHVPARPHISRVEKDLSERLPKIIEDKLK